MGDLGVSGLITRGQIVSTLAGKNRIALLGDSIALFALFYANVPTSANSFTVSNGVGTINLGANTGVLTGSYFGFGNIGDPTASHPDNGRMIQAITASTPTTASQTITFASQAANGDYSAFGGSNSWVVAAPAASSGKGIATWINNFLRSQFSVTCAYAYVGALSTQAVAFLPKLISGPPVEYVLVSCGINDIRAATVTNRTTAIAAAIAAFANIQTIVSTLQAAGKKVILLTVPPSNNVGGSGSTNQDINVACSQMRQMILKLGQANSQLTVLDVFKEGIAGQVSASNGTYFLSNMCYDGTHPSPNCNMTTMLNQSASIILPPPLEISPVTVLDDIFNYSQSTALYPNYQQNSGLPGTSGTLAGGATGSASTNWTLTNVSATTVGTGNFTPTQIGTQNTQNYGFAERIQCTTTGASQGWQFKGGAGNLPVAGQWYEAGVRVYARSATTGVKSMSGFVNLGPLTISMSADDPTDTIGYQLAAGQVMWLKTNPFYLSIQPSFAFVQVGLASIGSGSSDLEISAPFIRPVDNPYV